MTDTTTDQALFDQVMGNTPDDLDRKIAFFAFQTALEGAPKRPTERTWIPVQAAYDAWLETLPKHELQRIQSEQINLRGKGIQPFQASPEALVLDAYYRYRGKLYNSRRVKNGRHAPIDATCAYDYDRRPGACGRAVTGIRGDATAWKAPEAM